MPPVQLLWRFNEEAVQFRIAYLMQLPKGAESHTVLVSDIPGLNWGTILQRLDSNALWFLPGWLKRRLRR